MQFTLLVLYVNCCLNHLEIQQAIHIIFHKNINIQVFKDYISIHYSVEFFFLPCNKNVIELNVQPRSWQTFYDYKQRVCSFNKYKTAFAIWTQSISICLSLRD